MAVIATTRPLTRREIEVLTMHSAGLTHAQIAERLFIEVATVRFHCQGVYRKLGASNSRMAIKIAVGTGIIPCPFCCGR